MPSADKDTESFLARIRDTIAKSEHLVAESELRIAETDRMLERQGLTREQVMAMRFSDAQIEAANEELRRRGMDPLEKWAAGDDPTPPVQTTSPSEAGNGHYAEAELENRSKKFGMMMKPFQI